MADTFSSGVLWRTHAIDCAVGIIVMRCTYLLWGEEGLVFLTFGFALGLMLLLMSLPLLDFFDNELTKVWSAVPKSHDPEDPFDLMFE